MSARREAADDRGSNFDYLTDEQNAQLPVFFSWFPALNKVALEALRTGAFEPPGAPKIVANTP